MRHALILSAFILLAGLPSSYAQTGFQNRPPPVAEPADPFGDEPLPPNVYNGGRGSPFSPRASNIEGGRMGRSEIAPRLPEPDAAGDGPRAYLVAAQNALMRHRTGAAQEALERAQTRILSRSTDPALADRPDDRGLSRAITDARLALGQHDIRRAQAILAQVLAPRQ